MKKEKLVFNNRTLTYEKPHKTIWTDKLISYVLEKVRKGFTYKQIARELDVSDGSIYRAICAFRRKPEWAGKIPYIAYKKRPPEIREEDRIGILDIEVWGGFYANKGFMIAYCIKEHNKSAYHTGLIEPEHIHRGIYDKFLCKKLVADLLQFDVIVGYYSGDRRFDLPYVRTRCAYHHIDFPFYNTIKHIDLYKTIKYKFKLDHSTLDEACKIFGIGKKKHLDYEVWKKFVFQGNKKAGKEIQKYNINDCIITDNLFNAVKNYDAMALKSI